ALLFGTTWLVNAIAISGVLVMILFANLVVLRSRKVNLRLAFPLLVLSLVFLYFFPIQTLNELSFLPRLIAGGGLLSLPFFFS
ncbi:MAG: spermidine synthase, partial [Armatimonadetes bacterium]|nr:spermidine synthase [Armatimonadota bacterium]NIO98179.1 spermidine synthase [Armatimonadota bacterium]